MKNVDDIVIIGGGLAGLFCALKLAPRPVTIITTEPIGVNASSVWAQGGIAAAMGDDDTPESHMRDTIKAGDGIVDHKIAKIMTAEAPDRINDLLEFGVPFDRDGNGKLALSREAAHSHNRIVRVSGDRAGLEIMTTLAAAVTKAEHINIHPHCEVEAIHCDNKRLTAITVRHINNDNIEKIAVKGVVLATGGIGHLYNITTNPSSASGSGIAMAARAGAIVADCEFVQFHPTAMAVGLNPAPLATEALRGEGALLINSKGERFMATAHPDSELAPRDVVARAVYQQISSGKGAFLDCREHPGRNMSKRFSTVYQACRNAGIDPLTTPIPIAPAAHYYMGGVVIDACGRTSIDGLWACGEVASSGVHGANRLASNSLLEALVFADRVAKDINGLMLPASQAAGKTSVESTGSARSYQATFKFSQQRITNRLRHIMSDKVGVERSGVKLREAITEITDIGNQAINPQLRDMALVALMIATTAYQRQESRGCHFRTDFPETRSKLQKRTFTTLAKIKAVSSKI